MLPASEMQVFKISQGCINLIKCTGDYQFLSENLFENLPQLVGVFKLQIFFLEIDLKRKELLNCGILFGDQPQNEQ